ncbi:MAG: hypothetical protein ACTHQ3_18335 [Motilibacteraceae bacterium]
MSQGATALARLAEHASPAAVALARAVLEQDVSDAAWAEQVGPALTQSDTARLLGKSEQAVSKDPRLLRVRNRDGRPVYPVVQFDGRSQRPGVAEVVAALAPVLAPLTVASWLTTPNPELLGARPVDALADDASTVLTLARRLAAAAG